MRSFTVNRTLEINYLHILPAVTTSCLGCIDFALELWWCIEYVSELLYPWAPPPPTERTSWPGCSIPPVTLWLRVDNSEEGESIFFLWRDLLEIIYKLHYHCVKVIAVNKIGLEPWQAHCFLTQFGFGCLDLAFLCSCWVKKFNW